MNCSICKHGTLTPGKVTVTLERASTTVVFKNVPAQVCSNCGEEYVEEATAATLLKQAGAAVAAGVQIEVRSFAA